MYNPSDFLKKYTSLEDWAGTIYDEGIKGIEKEHHDRRIQKDMTYFRNVRNILTHNPNGDSRPLIELTVEFKERFDDLCQKLMSGISDSFIIKVMKEKLYSYVPVMNGKKVWGVFGETTVFNMVSDGEPLLMQEDLQLFKIANYITEYSETGFFEFMSANSSKDDVRKLFVDSFENGRRLDVIYFTTTGDKKGDLIGLVTVWDLPSL